MLSVGKKSLDSLSTAGLKKLTSLISNLGNSIGATAKDIKNLMGENGMKGVIKDL